VTLQAVIFDVDGTLADTEEAHRQAFNETFRAQGLPWEWDVPLYRELLAVTGGKERMHHYCERSHPAYLAQPGARDMISRLHEEKTRRYTQLVEGGGITARPGILRLLSELHAAGVRLAIATTTTRANVDALLATTLKTLPQGIFEVIGSGEDAAIKKPAPDIYLHVLDRLGLMADECLAIEDSRNGLRAAQGAGIPALITECRWTAGEDFDGAVAVLSDLGEPHCHHKVVRSALFNIGYIDAIVLRRWHTAWRFATRGLAS
jgi:HAD superfamily hydrolase (TIGR01509 family)